MADGAATDGTKATLCAIAIMAKESVAGRVKTRLCPPLAPEESAELNTRFLRDISANIAAAARLAPIQGFAAYHPPGSEAFFHDILPAGFRLIWPKEAGIGRALFNSARDLLADGYASMCLVNADSPNLPTAYFAQAAELLARPGDRVVLGPSDDGGYYLIGLKRFHARLFEDIDWSTERVTGQTLERAAEIGLPVETLPAWYDVDDGEMLARLAADLLTEPRTGSAAPESAAFVRRLREAGRV
jgi:rSAM/selenodomain-associated transferase 1